MLPAYVPILILGLGTTRGIKVSYLFNLFMIRDNSRLAMNLYPASKAVKEIEAVYRMGIAVGLFKTMPDTAISVYGGPLE
jgi:hypothetical protein